MSVSLSVFRKSPSFFNKIVIQKLYLTSEFLLIAPTTEMRRAQRGTKRSEVSSKNIFRSYLL